MATSGWVPLLLSWVFVCVYCAKAATLKPIDPIREHTLQYDNLPSTTKTFSREIQNTAKRKTKELMSSINVHIKVNLPYQHSRISRKKYFYPLHPYYFTEKIDKVRQRRSITKTHVVSTPSNENDKKKNDTAIKPQEHYNSTTNGKIVEDSALEVDNKNKTTPGGTEKILLKINTYDSMWAALSLGILFLLLFGAVWCSKIWRHYPELNDSYAGASDTTTEMAWSKYGHTTTVSLKELVDSKKKFFKDLQAKVKRKITSNSRPSNGNHKVKYSKLSILPNDDFEGSDDVPNNDFEGSDDEDILFKRN